LLLPWVGFIVILGFVSTVLGVIFLPLAEIVNGANLVLLWTMHQIVSFLSALPMAQVFLPCPNIALIVAYYLLIIAAIEAARRKIPLKPDKFKLAVFLLIFFLFLVWHNALSVDFKGLTVTVLDAGQGDSILIESPSNQRMLIDAGERAMGERVVVPFLRKKGITKLDIVVLTHPHEDHVGGLPYVLEKIKVENVLEPGASCNSIAYKRFLYLINKNKIKYQLARAGQTVRLGVDVVGQILHPSDNLDRENLNNVSVVMKLVYKNFSMMLTGDNEQEGEQAIINRFPAASLRCQILKAGHHGSATSTSPDFLAAINPCVAVISCGKHNKFRHPHKSTLAKLQNAGVRTYRTDLNGAVVIKSDGNTYSIVLQK